jgi:ribosomal protein L14E/L6E/L27E
VLINYGENKGKICTIIDVVDAKRVSFIGCDVHAE